MDEALRPSRIVRPKERETLYYQDGIWRTPLENGLRAKARAMLELKRGQFAPVLDSTPKVPIGGIAPTEQQPLSAKSVRYHTQRAATELLYSELRAASAELAALVRARQRIEPPCAPALKRSVGACVAELAMHVQACAHLAACGAPPSPDSDLAQALAPAPAPAPARKRGHMIARLEDALAALAQIKPDAPDASADRLARSHAVRGYMLARRIVARVDAILNPAPEREPAPVPAPKKRKRGAASDTDADADAHTATRAKRAAQK